MKRLGVFLFLASAAGSQPLESSAAFLESAWQQFEATSWDAAYAAWQGMQPQAACRRYPGGEHPTIPDELWSYRCSEAGPSLDVEWLFYALSPDEPVTAHLEQFRTSIAGRPPAQLEEARGALSARLTTRFGPGQDPGRVNEVGSAFWRNVRRWRTNDLEIYLYVFQQPGTALSLHLEARRRTLLDALASDRRLQDSEIAEWAESGTPLDRQLARQLAEFPKAASVLSSEARPEGEHAAMWPALLQVLDASKTGSAERRARMMLAGDRLAGRLLVTKRQSPEWDAERKLLANYGLTFQWDELGGVWHYNHELLWRVWREYNRTAWSEPAFRLLLSRGWETRSACASGSDQFRAVIANGERFLRDRPKSPLRARILLLLAQSYETWWSLSLAGDNDDYADRRKYQDGAADARRKAIEWYDRLLRLPNAEDRSAGARRALPRLKLGIDTMQRRFFCIYD